MKNSDRTPSELLDYIGDIIRERQSKSLPTYYTISIEQFEKSTPVAEKEDGYDNFKKQVMKYMSDYNLTSITIQLFSGKSHNVKNPFQTFKVPLKKQNPSTIILGGNEDKNSGVQQIDSGISVHRYYDEKFEMQIRIMKIELEKQTLTDKVALLTEKYEEKIKDQEDRNHEKIKDLEQEILLLEKEIRDFEREIAENEKAKHNSFGNIALGSVGSKMIENFSKSEMGIGVLKGLLGINGYETLQGHLAGIESEQNQIEKKETARLITAPDTNNPRQIALTYIQKVGEQLNDMYLRMLYDIAELTVNNVNDLQVLWNLAQQIQKQRDKTETKNPQPEENTGKKNEDNQDEDDEEDLKNKID